MNLKTKHKIKMYKATLQIVLTDSPEYANKAIGVPYFQLDETLYATAHHSFKKSNEYFTIVLNPLYPYKALDHGTIAHECVHIAHMILNSRGVVADYDNDEPEAYLLGMISNKVYKFLNKYEVPVG